MKAFIAGVLAVILIAFSASFILRGIQNSSEDAYTTTGARPK